MDLFLKKTSTIGKEINEYFKELFYFYGIEDWGRLHNISFLEMAFDLSSKNNYNVYIQREEFIENIQRLLKRSGKEKIVIVFNNIDYRKELYNFIWIISNIPGIFSVLNITTFNGEIEDLEKYVQGFIPQDDRIQ